MGKENDVVVMIEPVHDESVQSPSGRFIKSMIKIRKALTKEVEPTGHRCHGPSFMHNLLPILEPFITFNPRLLFIEDHILGRQTVSRTPSTHKLPSSLDELRLWVERASLSCECDECAPQLYELEGKFHGTIAQHETAQARSNHFSHAPNIMNTPRPELRLRSYGEHEAMRLVRHHIAWLDQTYLQTPNSNQSTSVLQLQSLLEAWNPNLNGPNMRQSMSPAQCLHLISTLNNIFFFSAIPPHRQSLSTGFSWLPETQKNCFGIGSYNPIIGTQILLHPTLYRHHNTTSNPDDIRWRSRLGTILHELCHAYLKAYTCRSCPTHDESIGPRGHGRAWQLLAAKVEQVAERLTGGAVDMGRYPALLHDLEGHGKLPSRHDLEVYGFGKREVGVRC